MYARVGNVSEAMALCQEGCAYACQHAVLTAYLRQLPQEASPALARLCPKDQLGDGRTYWQCAHGVGHGLAHHFSDVQQALTACKEFSLPLGRKFCALGVLDRKSTRLNSSHSQISYAVFCLKKKNRSAAHAQCAVRSRMRVRIAYRARNP